MSSAADWCRAVLEEVSPSPLNSVPPLPAHVPVPPPPPPAFRGSAAASSSAVTSAATTTNSSIPQPSAQYQAYYNQYYQQAYPAAQAVTTRYTILNGI